MRSIDEADRQTADLGNWRKIKRTLRFNYASSSYQYKLLRRSQWQRREKQWRGGENGVGVGGDR